MQQPKNMSNEELQQAMDNAQADMQLHNSNLIRLRCKVRTIPPHEVPRYAVIVGGCVRAYANAHSAYTEMLMESFERQLKQQSFTEESCQADAHSVQMPQTTLPNRTTPMPEMSTLSVQSDGSLTQSTNATM